MSDNPDYFQSEAENFGAHRFTFVQAPGPHDSIVAPGPATIYDAFPYLPDAARFSLVYRLQGIKWFLTTLMDQLQAHLNLERTVRIYGVESEAPIALATLGRNWQTFLGQGLEWVVGVLIAETRRLQSAEDARRWHSVFAAAPSPHADTVIQRLNEVAELIDIVLPAGHDILQERLTTTIINGEQRVVNRTYQGLGAARQIVDSLIDANELVADAIRGYIQGLSQGANNAAAGTQANNTRPPNPLGRQVATLETPLAIEPDATEDDGNISDLELNIESFTEEDFMMPEDILASYGLDYNEDRVDEDFVPEEDISESFDLDNEDPADEDFVPEEDILESELDGESHEFISESPPRHSKITSPRTSSSERRSRELREDLTGLHMGDDEDEERPRSNKRQRRS